SARARSPGPSRTRRRYSARRSVRHGWQQPGAGSLQDYFWLRRGQSPVDRVGFDRSDGCANGGRHDRSQSDPVPDLQQVRRDDRGPRRDTGAYLGAFMGGLARDRRDQLTLLTSPTLSSCGLWVEQLIAESTGKEGNGIVPVVGEPFGSPDVYGKDRCFVALRL